MKEDKKNHKIKERIMLPIKIDETWKINKKSAFLQRLACLITEISLTFTKVRPLDIELDENIKLIQDELEVTKDRKERALLKRELKERLATVRGRAIGIKVLYKNFRKALEEIHKK
jgi:hypothetical protein